ncbi:bifunctional glutamate--cysteine ligase GshA/glutathione synthetase GshB [Clostridium paraputrificum]|uniref:bifunctional glutamate--cysteine ligase GshA/glutathione synthetase GshB n=1 Tax=Clostridium TaxID=1485 RepID=UPI000C075085|nr:MULTISPECIES: bifunctional glutamate--cysteine ligase GshA/glutathione synthetase GshB [Clostridium]MDB2089787.1 bifunctional glutamate--cysteine ligase GshA/glutathione synthetase GshB [Clostridium paraputrificum]MDB2096038.1 bifunctional glutamate--cysteine ligase GshA/glutathione synthetase GshB [Clostridium paraputrificum]MDB2104704.1 bifunctional glutamate--cysteine ligase GshA/glutathione synthetase GshB [Clostridium paraputrificum]MDB2125433.1 bifunctional glutamate--cysteine ligase G
MLNTFKALFTSDEILRGNFGVEREGLRVGVKGELSRNKHPKVFGNKIMNPYITTDFSESQLELITPVFNTSKEVYDFLNALYDIVALEIGDEYIWPESMPCIIPDDREIPIATFCKCKQGEEARAYREELLRKYGGKIQLISGIHYNFSLDDDVLNKLYENSSKKEDFKTFKDNLYLKIVRNYLRYRWLLIYLLGSTGVVHSSYKGECLKKLDNISQGAYSCEGIVSYRNSDCGYGNRVTLFADYTSTREYVNSLKRFINDGLIQSPKEFYSSVRPKGKNPNKILESLLNEGIQYLEYRSIDINPFSKGGISLEDLEFLELFNLYLLFKEESNYKDWQIDGLENQKNIARNGGLDIELIRDGEKVSKVQWGLEILNEIRDINHILNLGKGELIDAQIEKIKDYKKTNTYRFIELVKEKGYIDSHLDLSKKYKKEAYTKRFNLKGFEDMELSTQILMKEAIKRGIKFEVLDREDNFISLEKNGKLEYIKQATKTSVDNYATVLAMNNKVVTKKILDKKDVRVPKGEEFTSIDESIRRIEKYVNLPVVIKPKSTNFGLGISIFPDGGGKEELTKALDFAFSKDNTVLIEEFIKGKEFRFLVIGDKVSGILHRVPANVKGDGKHTIEELIEIKNKDSLRGKGYKTPLEKIEIDTSVLLYLKNHNRDIYTVLKEGEEVFLRENSNISTGGDSIDFTDVIPNRFKEIAIKSAKSIGAKICGVDMVIEDYTDERSNYGIIELNFNPAIHIHSYPYEGKERNVAKDILNLLGFKESQCD